MLFQSCESLMEKAWSPLDLDLEMVLNWRKHNWTALLIWTWKLLLLLFLIELMGFAGVNGMDVRFGFIKLNSFGFGSSTCWYHCDRRLGSAVVSGRYTYCMYFVQSNEKPHCGCGWSSKVEAVSKMAQYTVAKAALKKKIISYLKESGFHTM